MSKNPQINSMDQAATAVEAYRPVELRLRDEQGELNRVVKVRKLCGADAQRATVEIGNAVLAAHGNAELLLKIPESAAWLVMASTGLTSAEYDALALDEIALILAWVQRLNLQDRVISDFFAVTMATVQRACNALGLKPPGASGVIE